MVCRAASLDFSQCSCDSCASGLTTSFISRQGRWPFVGALCRLRHFVVSSWRDVVMASSKRSKLIGALGAIMSIAFACGDDGKSSAGVAGTGGSNGNPPAAGAVGKQCAADADCGTGATCSKQQGFGTLSSLLSLVGVANLP